MGGVRFALRWPYTFFVLALLILFLGVTAFAHPIRATRSLLPVFMSGLGQSSLAYRSPILLLQPWA